MINKQIDTKSIYLSNIIKAAMKRIYDYPLTVVEAPMGYGKTTAVREYLKIKNSNVLWQRIYDASLTVFWNDFGRLFSDLNPSVASALVKLGFPCDGVSRQEALFLIEKIEFPENTVLVIDDYHLVSNHSANSFIELLVRCELPNLHIVLTERYDHFDNLEELKLKGVAHHVSKEAFELTPSEIKAYYKLCGVNIKGPDADNLYSMTEGWISALYLMMMDFLSEGSYSKVTDIYNLFEKAVYFSLSDEIKDFLLRMCIFECFTLEQAKYIWGKENAEQLLTEIIAKNAFVSFDSDTARYSMHSIFTNFLKEKLEKKNIEQELYQKSAQWFLQAGDFNQATHYFYICSDFENLYRTIEIFKESGQIQIQSKEIAWSYLVECPDGIRAKHHMVVLILAFELFTYNEIDLFQKTCEEFVRNINTDTALREADRNTLLGEFEMVMSFRGYNDIKKMAEHNKKAEELLTKPSIIMSTNSGWTFSSPSVLFLFYRESEMLKDHVADMIENMPRYSRLANGNASGGGQIMKAEWHYFLGEYENAEITAHKAMFEANSEKQTASIMCTMFLQLRLALMRGDFEKITMLLNQMLEIARASGEFQNIYTLNISEGYVYALLNQSDRIPTWIETGDFSDSQHLFPVFGMLNIVYGRALLIKGEYLKLIGSEERFLAPSAAYPNLLGKIYTYIYLAAANKQISRKKEALDALRIALDIAMSDRVFIPFVENSDYIGPLLEELKYKCWRDEIAEIINLSEAYLDAVKRIEVEYFSDNKVELTKREKEIAQLAAEGFSNKEIGSRLFISQNTVKTQMKSVFEKLHINSRALLQQYIDKINE